VKKFIAVFTVNNLCRAFVAKAFRPGCWTICSIRALEREISGEQFELMAEWLRTDPNVPEGKWFKQFPGLTICGEGELISQYRTGFPTGRPVLPCPNKRADSRRFQALVAESAQQTVSPGQL
jgi:hypothetical protein